jgi:shikimate kinase
MRVNQPLLIIMTGPVGGGKSTTSIALARALRRTDLSVAVIDLDQMYGFVQQQDGYDDQTAWARTRYGAGGLANALFATSMSIVIADGEFFTEQELSTLRALLPPDIEQRFFTLRLSYDQALVRVQGDPARGVSKDPVILRSLHDSFAQALPFLEKVSVVIDTNTLTQDEVVAQLMTVLDDGGRFTD